MRVVFYDEGLKNEVFDVRTSPSCARSAGGKRSSLVERYVNLSSVEVEQAVMGIAGIKDREVQRPIFVPGICLHCMCKEEPPAGTDCPECGNDLTEEAQSDTEMLIRSVRENPLSLRKTVDGTVEEKMQ